MSESDGMAMLKQGLDKAKRLGHEYITFTINRPNSPNNWDRVLLVRGRPSLYARCIGATGQYPGHFLVECKTADVAAFLDGVGHD